MDIFVVLFILLGLNFTFSFFGAYLLADWEDKKSKKYYDKYVLMLAIHIDNHSSDKFVPPCHGSYFINGNRQKLTAWYFIFSSFRNTFVSELHVEEQKWLFIQKKKKTEKELWKWKVVAWSSLTRIQWLLEVVTLLLFHFASLSLFTLGFLIPIFYKFDFDL